MIPSHFSKNCLYFKNKKRNIKIMIMLHRFKLIVLSAALLGCSFIASHQVDEHVSTEMDCITEHESCDSGARLFDCDDIFFDDEDDNPFSNEFLDTVAIDHIIKTPTPEDIITILLAIGILDILKEPLYLHTNSLNRRSLLDQPIFEPDRAEFPGLLTVGSHFFVRKTNRSNFTRDSTKLSSYISLEEETLISRLQNSIGKITELFPEYNIDVEKIFSLFENMTVEERQAGLMFHCTKKYKKTTFRILAPIYYLERNFSLTKKEQDAVARELGALDPEEELRFRKAHFISDKIGFGDTRIEIDQQIIKRPAYSFRCGGQATIPTAFTWGKGFLGSSFAKPSTLPTFNLDPIFEAIENPTPETEQAVFTSLSNFFLDGFDRLAADLLDVKLGNNRHLGVGFYTRGKTALSSLVNTPFAEKMSLTSRLSVELFFPSTEKKFYTTKIDEHELNNRDFKDPKKAAQNVLFLEEQIIERIFLRAFDTHIRPGSIFRWSGEARYKGEKSGWNLGVDFWLQGKDRFGSIDTSCFTVEQLDIAKAKGPNAFQGKVFGGFIFKHKSPLTSWFFSVNADVTAFNKGIGKDFGLSINCEASF
jgi:hypothetical protein